MILGRDTELREISDLLEEWSLVTIVGPGGVGKTTLARAAATEVERFDFVDLTAVTGEDLHQIIAGELGHPSYAELARTDREDRLIVLDKCEHLIDKVADFVDDFLTDCQGRVLATSREPMGASHERVYWLRPMSTEGRPSPAGRLLERLIEARGLGESFDPDELEALAAQLDGLPLAMELASARLTMMSPGEIRIHLRDRLDLLSRQRPRGPQRHQSLNAAIAWSHDLLDETQRTSLVTLGVFDGAFTLACASAAIDSEDAATLRVLADLVDRSLVTTTRIGEQTWYRLYDTVRVFSRDQLSDTDFNSIMKRVIDEVTGMAAHLAFPRETSHRLEVQQEVAALYPIWREAIEWCLLHSESPAQVFTMLSPMWWMEDLGHQLEVAEMIERALRRWPGPLDEARATVIAVQAALLRVANRREDAWEKASFVREEAPSGLGLALALRTAGMVRRGEGAFDEAKEHLLASAKLADEIGFKALSAEVEMHIALDEAREGLVDQAVARLRAGLGRDGIAGLTLPWLQTTLAYVLVVSDPEEAVSILQDVGAGHFGPLDPWSRGSAQEQLGYVYAIEGEVAKAASHYLEALEVFETHHNLPGLWGVIWGSAALFARVGSSQWEQRCLATAEDLFGTPVTGPFEEEIYEAIAGHHEPVSGQTPVSLSQVRSQLERLVDDEQPSSEVPAPPASFARHGDSWLVGFAGTEAHVRHSKGMEDLAKLIASPGTEIGALDLMGSVITAGGIGELLDAEARSQYRKRLRELSEEVEAAVALGAGDEAERLRNEMEAIAGQLGAAYGLGGKARTTGDPAEKARSAVTWRIRSAIKRISSANPPAGDHLDRFVSTGRFCVYDPPQPVDWNA